MTNLLINLRRIIPLIQILVGFIENASNIFISQMQTQFPPIAHRNCFAPWILRGVHRHLATQERLNEMNDKRFHRIEWMIYKTIQKQSTKWLDVLWLFNSRRRLKIIWLPDKNEPTVTIDEASDLMNSGSPTRGCSYAGCLFCATNFASTDSLSGNWLRRSMLEIRFRLTMQRM